MALRTTVHETWDTVDQAAWDALVDPDAPLLRHAWLAGLERSGCTTADRGWQPRPVTLHVDDQLVAGVPAYVVDHDDGQFVYQLHWRKAMDKANLSMSPKLVVCVPFTPVTGPRLVVGSRPKLRRRAVEAAFEAGDGCRSLHVLFPPQSERTAWTRAGLFWRKQFSYEWTNRGYASYEDFLGAFRSKRRKELRRERREVAHVQIEVVEQPDDALLSELWDAYSATIERYGGTQRYLNRAFFLDLGQHMRDRLVAIRASLDGRFVGGSLNVRGSTRLYGRYWGQLDDVRFLHFEVCYHRAIEYCIERGLSAFEPGFGGDHKFRRGFEVVENRSAHRFASPHVQQTFARTVHRETSWVDDRIAELRATSPLKP